MQSVYIPPDSQQRLMALARATLEGFVRGSEIPADDAQNPYLLSSHYGAFVSLHNGEKLRGCIGSCFPTLPLYRTVIEMTEAAASRDHRVAPINTEELPAVRIDISVLSPLEVVGDPLSLQVGKHGLHISHGKHHGVLLPQVAIQYGWDMETFLRQACMKAGLPKNGWKWPETKIMAFTALIIEEKK